ncbi:hydroxyacid dehydrogenase [Streptomyces sp. ISL-11]|uniref:hydroxyacid dehydrogenase n=1 Tax=Streptomyces sp. ISL-11 TaxID=2819174 RepID=UPI001BE779FE|nr:hydroxyacid dehydrogenase [Streptomyces sp. ISL-11]
MGAAEAAAVLPSDLRARLGEFAEPVPGTLTGALTAPGARETLARAEILITGWGCPPLTEEVLDGSPHLRAVVHAAGSVRRLVTEGVWERGIVVSSAAEANAGPVADFTLAALTFAAKGAFTAAAAYEAGWPAFPDRRGADGRTIGVIGASRIGRRVIAGLRASDAGYRILLYDPYVAGPDAAGLGAEAVGLDELCGASDIVTVHAPHTPETYRLLDARHLALIPDGGTVINTARGALIDTFALTRECATGRLDAMLDVTDPEPLPAGHPLLHMPNVLVTPHVAGAQGSEARRLGAWAVEEVARLVNGVPPAGRVRRGDLDRLA